MSTRPDHSAAAPSEETGSRSHSTGFLFNSGLGVRLAIAGLFGALAFFVVWKIENSSLPPRPPAAHSAP